MKTVLVSSLGGTPQVITETLWALMNPSLLTDPEHRKRSPTYPDKVYLITTAFMQAREAEVRQRIIDVFKSAGEEHAISDGDIEFQVVRFEDGTAIQDIRTEAENVAYANHITTLIKHLVDADPDNETRIHMSLAGGRKSMSSYDHTAMMYFGRVQDELSHTLVDPPALEGCPGFWWPGQPEATVNNREDVQFPTSVEFASVDLVSMPFARLGVRLRNGPLPEAMDHGLLTLWIETAFSDNELVIDITDSENPHISYGSEVFHLRPVIMAFYATLAVAQQDGWPDAGPFGLGGNHTGWVCMKDFQNPDSLVSKTYTSIWWRIKRDGDEGKRSFARTLGEGQRKDEDGGAWEMRLESTSLPLKSKLKSELAKAVENAFILPRLLPQEGPRNENRIGLSIPPEKIVLKGFGEAERGQGTRVPRAFF